MSKFKYDLTIGMIVKNEIKYLRRCLETLQPLRDAISCQLIITDTGSTDGTKEVAQEFADVYLEFDWCDDFSKARNTGVDAAQGRWFFYVDADNDFDDSLLEIAHFLKRPHVDHDFDAASLIIRNYSDTSKQHYNDIVRSWILNFSYKKRYFQGAIHESIPVNQNKLYPLSTLMHHWGYMTQVIDQKNDRNLPILRKIFQENPSDLKNRVQLGRELSDPVEKRAFFQDSIQFMKPLAQKSDDAKMWLMVMRNQFQYFALHIKDFALVDTLIQDWETYLSGSIFEINFLGFCMESYLQQGKEVLLFETFPRYQTLFFKQRKQSDARFKLFDNFRYATDLHYYQVEFRTIHQAIETGNTEIASQWVTHSKSYQYRLPDGIHKYIFDVVHCCFLLEEYGFLAEVFSFSTTESAPHEQKMMLQELEKRYYALPPAKKQTFLRDFATGCTHWYFALTKLRFYQNNLTLCPKEVVDWLQTPPPLSDPFLRAPLLYSALISGGDPLPYLGNLAQLPQLESHLLKMEPDFDPMLLTALKRQPPQQYSLGEKQALGYLGIGLSLRRITTPECTSIFWTALTLLVFSVAEQGLFSQHPHLQTLEQAAVLLWQAKDSPELFAQEIQSLQSSPLAPILSKLTSSSFETLWECQEKKKQIITTIQSLFLAQRQTEAMPLIQGMKQAHPQEHHPLFYQHLTSDDPVEEVNKALSRSLTLLDTPLSQVKKKFLEKQYSTLL